MSGMLGLIGQGPQSDPEVQARRAELIPSGGAGDIWGAQIAQSFTEAPVSRTARIVASGYAETAPGTYEPLNATLFGMPTGALPPGPMVPLATLKEQYDIPGVLSFNKDTPQPVAQSLYDHKIAQMRRAQVIGRADNMLTQGMAARFIASMIGSIADPVNLAAMFVPGVNEATAARMLAVSAGASALERAGVRALAGATQGAAGMAALEPLNYALSRQERDDWTMGGALLNVLIGTVAGAGLHSGMGALMERSRGLPAWAPARVASERMQTASPEVQQALGRGAVAAQAEGRPFEASAILDLSENLEAAQQIRRLADAQTRIEAEAAQELAAVRAQREQAGRRNTPAEAAARSGDMAGRLRAEADSLQSDMARVRERALASGMDEPTAGRLEAVDAELSGTIPAARRRALVAERTMLMEGRGALDESSAGALSAGRDAAELKGLQAALDRATAGADRAEAAMAVAAKEAEVVAGQRAALARQADAGERAAMSRLEARQAVVDANAARAMRQIAGALDSRLSPQQALELGRAVARGQATLTDAVAAIERWRTDNVTITPESLAGELANADLLARAERDAAALERQARTSFEEATTPRVDPAAGQPPPPASRTGLAPPDPKPPGEPGAAARNLSDVEKQTKALDDLIRLSRPPTASAQVGTAFSGALNLGHARLTEQGPLTRFSSIAEAQDRFDGDGGTFGGGGVYLDNSGAWTGGDRTHMGARTNYRVQANFERAFVLSPDTVGAFAERFGATREAGAELQAALDAADYGTTRATREPTAADFARLDEAQKSIVTGTQVADALRKEGYDGIIVQGFDDLEGTPAHDALAKLLVQRAMPTEILQDQVFAFNPERVLVTGEAAGRSPRETAVAKSVAAPDPMIERLKAYDALVDEEARVDAAVFETAANCIVRR